MKKIKYELNGEWVEIEVTDSFAESYELITRESTRNDWKHNKRNQKYHASLEVLTESGFQIASDEPTPAEEFEKHEQIAMLRQALTTLTKDQQWLITEVYFKGRPQIEIANELGLDPTAIRNRLRKIYKRIKKFLV